MMEGESEEPSGAQSFEQQSAQCECGRSFVAVVKLGGVVVLDDAKNSVLDANHGACFPFVCTTLFLLHCS